MVDPATLKQRVAQLPVERQFAAIRQEIEQISDPIERDTLFRWFMFGLEMGSERASRQVVVLVHGIRTHAEWQDRVAALLSKFENITVYPIGYEYFDAFQFWVPILTRSWAIRRVRTKLRNIRAEHPGEEISVIAHSFGTYVITKILQKETDIQLGRLLLCGSVVKQDFDWARIPRRPHERVLNDVGSKDVWPVLAKCLSWGYGPSGTFGFKTNEVRDRFHALGHSEFFTESHITTYWLPFIVDRRVVPSSFESNRPASPIPVVLLWFPWKLFAIGSFVATVFRTKVLDLLL